MSNIDKQAVAGDVNAKTYYIHPAAFGSTTNPGYGHVPVVHADDFEKQRAKLEAAEKRIAELQAPAPELKMAHLINKFYERYPLAEFKSDTERSAALGYFMAGAELQCFGEFINYAELMGDE